MTSEAAGPPRELLLMRHGKSEWPSGIPDFERRLDRRGRRASERIGRWVVEAQILPGRIVSSPAVRARETTERFCSAAGLDLDAVRWSADVYEASLDDLVGILRDTEQTTRLLLIGHNPGLESLVRWLCVSPPPPTGGNLMPTAALARIEIRGDWAAVSPGSGRLASLIHPRELEDT